MRIWYSLHPCLQVQIRTCNTMHEKFFRLRLTVDLEQPFCRVLQIACSPEKEYLGLLRYGRLPRFYFNCCLIGHQRHECQGPCLQELVPNPIGYGAWMITDSFFSKINWSSDRKLATDYSNTGTIPRSQPFMEIESPFTGHCWFERGESSMHSHLPSSEARPIKTLVQAEGSFHILLAVHSGGLLTPSDRHEAGWGIIEIGVTHAGLAVGDGGNLS